MNRHEIIDEKTKPQGTTRGVKNAGVLADSATFSFQFSFLSWDDDAVPISSTFHTLSRWGQGEKTKMHRKLKLLS